MAITYTGTNKKIAENILSKGGTVVNPDTQNKTGMFSSATTATKTPTTTTTPQTGADKWGANAEKAVVTNNAPVSGLANLTGTAKTTTPTTGSMYSDASTIAEQSKGLTYKYMSEESPGEGIKSPYQSQQDAFMAMMEEQAKTVNALSDQYKSAFSKLQTELGDSFNQFQEQLKKMNANQQGRQVDIADPQFQEEMKQAIANGQTDFTSILEKYQKSGNTPEQIQELQQLGEQAVGMGLDPQRAMEAIQSASERGVPSNAIKDYFNKQIAQGVKEQPADTQQAVATTDKDIALESPTPDDSLNPITEDPKPTKEKVENAMATLSGMDMASLGGALNGAGANMVDMTSPEGIATLLLQQGLDYADDDSIRNYLLNSAENAKNSYMYALESYKYAIEEIDSAIMGEDFVPTTSEGLSAKVYAQSKEMGLESIEAEKQYQKEQYTAWRSQEADKRGRLEGYLKAKLVAMGAEDSSAGLSMMALQVNAADLRLQQADSEYNYGLSRLNMQSREIMMNFANNITQLSMQADSNKNSALSSYTDRISEIEKDLIADDREKNKLRLDILGQYQDQMYKIDQDKKAQEWKEKEMAYKQIRDTVEDSYKLSGLMGTYYGVDANGNVFDSGIPTFDAKKWEQSNYMDQMRFQHTVENDAQNKALKLLDVYGSAAAGAVEVALGMPEGSLSQYSTLEEQKNATENWFTSLSATNATTGVNNPLENSFSDGQKVGQCGYFVRTKFFNLGPMGDTLSSKIKTMDNVLSNPNEKNKKPQIGDMVIFDVGTKAGHVSLCTGVNEDGTIRVLESNWKGDERVGRRESVKTNNIVAIHRGDLKPEYEKMLKDYTTYGDELSKNLEMASNVLGGLADKTGMIGGVFATIGGALGATSEGLPQNPFFTKSVEMMNGVSEVLLTESEFTTAEQKTNTADDFLAGINPQQASLIKMYVDGDETAKNIVNGMSKDDKDLFYQMTINYKASLPETSNVQTGLKSKFYNIGISQGLTQTEAMDFAKNQVLESYKSMNDVQTKVYDAFVKIAPESQSYNELMKNVDFEDFADGLNTISKKIKEDGLTAEVINRNIKDPTIRQALMSEMRWIEAKLRKESGAAISSSEYSTTGTMYFPRAGDDEATIKRKAEMRANVEKALFNSLSPYALRVVYEDPAYESVIDKFAPSSNSTSNMDSLINDINKL